MSNYWASSHRLASSRLQNLAWSGSGTLVSTNSTAQTYQVRIASQVAGWFAIDNLGTVPISAGGTGTWLPNTTV